jgi:hypothetical protein
MFKGIGTFFDISKIGEMGSKYNISSMNIPRLLDGRKKWILGNG